MRTRLHVEHAAGSCWSMLLAAAPGLLKGFHFQVAAVSKKLGLELSGGQKEPL